MTQYDPNRLAKLINAGRAADVIVRIAELEQGRLDHPVGPAPLTISFPGNPEPVGLPSVIAPRVISAIIGSLEGVLEEALTEARN